MKNTTFIEGVLLLCLCYLFVGNPTYWGGFLFGAFGVVFHALAAKRDK